MAQGVGLITGANGKIKINGKTLGYATGVTVFTRVDMISGETMGRYEVVSNEPISYSTGGSFSMLRYTLAADGNLPGIDTTNKSNSINSTGVGGQVNPSTILNSAAFDIEIYQLTGDVLDKSYQIFKIQDCRITSRSGGVNKRGIYEETFNFVGVLSQDDAGNDPSLANGPSGLGGNNTL